MSSYVAQWVDRGLTVKDDTQDSIVRAEVQRLGELLAIAVAAQSIPRRLGKDASDEELSADKQRAKRIAHVASQLLVAWSSKVKSTTIEAGVSKQAATVDWLHWWEDHRVWLINRRKYIATWASQNDVDMKWAKSALVKITNELNWLEYAMRSS